MLHHGAFTERAAVICTPHLQHWMSHVLSALMFHYSLRGLCTHVHDPYVDTYHHLKLTAFDFWRAADILSPAYRSLARGAKPVLMCHKITKCQSVKYIEIQCDN